MIIFGLILLVIGWVLGMGLLYTIGSILLVVGLILLLLGGVGHPVGGRSWWF
jgi:hypothetical protein